MFVRGIRVGELTPDSIVALVTDRVPESAQLDYKEAIGTEPREILADVSSFANSGGGVILYGVSDERDEQGNATGMPAAIAGLQSDENDDQLRRSYTNRLDDGLAPRIPGIATQVVRIDERRVLAVGVPRSLLAPHMVKSTGRFHRRREGNRLAMNVEEIRVAFMERDEWERQAEAFRDERLKLISAKEIDNSITGTSYFTLHVLPLGRLRDHHDVFRRTPIDVIRKFVPDDLFGLFASGNIRGTVNGPRLYYSEDRRATAWITLLRNAGVE